MWKHLDSMGKENIPSTSITHLPNPPRGGSHELIHTDAPVVMVWDVLSDILRAEPGEGQKEGSNREEEFLLWQCYRENGQARRGL